MDKIIYQGQQIEAASVSRIDGSDEREDGLHCWANELFRDTGGTYYAVRERWLYSEEESRTTQRTRTIRRINLRQAILWAICLTTIEEALRQDAAALLGSLPVAGATQSLAAFGWLDDHACKIVGARLAEEPGLDVRDLLNGAVEFLLRDPEDEWGTGSPESAVAWAKARRLVAEGGQHPTHLLTIALTDNQFRMLRQAARHDDRTPEEAVFEEMRTWTRETLVSCYGHQGDRVEHGWQPTGPKPPLVVEEEEEPSILTEILRQAADMDEAKEPEYSVLDYLEPQLALRVVRYLYLTPWQYQSADVVNGCVTYALNQAFAALDEDLKGKVPDDEGFVDNGWGFVEEKICASANQRTGGKPIQDKATTNRSRPGPQGTTLRIVAAGDGSRLADVEVTGEQVACIEEHAREQGLDFEEAFTSILRRGLSLSSALVAADHESDDAPLPMVDLRRLPAADRPDVALCAAGAVEPVRAEGKPISDVLHELAADWLGKAVEARSQALDFAATPARGKLAAQAELLEGCAAALYAALDGKEGK